MTADAIKDEYAGKEYKPEIRYYHRQKKRGLCVACGKEPLLTACYCNGCSEAHKERQRARYHNNKAQKEI